MGYAGVDTLSTRSVMPIFGETLVYHLCLFDSPIKRLEHIRHCYLIILTTLS
jgi:hypothetical protein